MPGPSRRRSPTSGITGIPDRPDRQRERFQTLKVDALKVGRAWAIKEAFSDFWDYRYTGSAHKFFDRWYFWATHSRLPPIMAAAKTLKRHLPGLLATTKHRSPTPPQRA
ncbi:hypothetical protein C4901_13750 [Acidiferrobacter sp. SPIII_3]|nr:hypothetical protein C4901_13750 [Acidiferrobacter sp. SPIII_3]